MTPRIPTMLFGLVLAVAGTNALAAGPFKLRSAAHSPHGVFMTVGEYQADLIYCGLAKPEDASGMKNEAYQALAAQGLYMADFDRDYEIGFQKSIIKQRSMSERGRTNYCKDLGHKVQKAQR